VRKVQIVRLCERECGLGENDSKQQIIKWESVSDCEKVVRKLDIVREREWECDREYMK
jgi:hypothetical protein